LIGDGREAGFSFANRPFNPSLVNPELVNPAEPVGAIPTIAACMM
jgi:hypothetical protein